MVAEHCQLVAASASVASAAKVAQDIPQLLV
jgi:hypothetical protein